MIVYTVSSYYTPGTRENPCIVTSCWGFYAQGDDDNDANRAGAGAAA